MSRPCWDVTRAPVNNPGDASGLWPRALSDEARAHLEAGWEPFAVANSYVWFRRSLEPNSLKEAFASLKETGTPAQDPNFARAKSPNGLVANLLVYVGILGVGIWAYAAAWVPYVVWPLLRWRQPAGFEAMPFTVGGIFAAVLPMVLLFGYAGAVASFVLRWVPRIRPKRHEEKAS